VLRHQAEVPWILLETFGAAKTTENEVPESSAICVRPPVALLFEVMQPREPLFPKIVKFSRPQQR
jgi:hypothetical protein